MPENTRAAQVLLEVSGVDLRFGPLPVLVDVSLAVHRGEIVTIVGPNGSGKTTLVRVALGLLAPVRGTVYRRPGIKIGYMPQHIRVDETLPLTVTRFLRLGGAAAAREVHRVLDEVGARHLSDSQMHDLSGGEMRRVLLARALLRDPDLLVLDEPVEGVDVIGQSDLYRLITRVRDRRGCGVLMISHDLHVVMAATDQVVCLNHHVCCTGQPEDVKRHPEYLALFGPQVSEGLAVYTHQHDHRHDVQGEVLPIRRREDDVARGS